MELNDPPPESTTRSPLFIDLNEIPSSSSTSPSSSSFPTRPDPASFDVVRSFHDNPDPASGAAAGFPGDEASSSACAACGGPEAAGKLVVCDGCERGFHVECAGGMRGREVVSLEEWICAECVTGGGKSKRWPLGVKRKRILDINASPPSDGDGEVAEELQDLRKHIPGHKSFDANGFGDARIEIGFKKGSGVLMHALGMGYEDVIFQAKTLDRSLEDADWSYPLGRLKGRLPYWNTSEILLQGLKEFISERHGVLGEGWHVELNNSANQYELYAVYRSPDGKTFGSMSEVAYHLGLMPNSNSATENGSCESSFQEKLQYTRKKKAKRSAPANGFSESRDSLVNCLSKKFLSNKKSTEDGQFDKSVEVMMEEDCVSNLQASNEGLPVQFEDFFILSLGKIDMRPSYHDASIIFPVGYRSCWHDKISGSIFMCEVLDGGDSGPLFRVRRFSCSALPVPDGSTILFRTELGPLADKRKEGDNMSCCIDGDNDVSVEVILGDPSPPTESDILTCLQNSSHDSCGVRTSDSQQSGFAHSSSGYISSNSLGKEDAIGEIAVEERSSESAWRLASQKLFESYSDKYKNRSDLRFFCNHVDNGIRSTFSDTSNEESKISSASLAKFCSTSAPSMQIDRTGELDAFAALLKWLNQDRFGLDTEFVQEMIEQLPGTEACSKYVFLRNRGHYLTSLTVGNGNITANRKYREESGDAFRSSKKLRFAEATDVPHPPSGKLLCARLPPVLAGDVYQVWELLRRFHEILHLKEPLSLEELEEEFINSSYGCSRHFEKLGMKVNGIQSQNRNRDDCMNGQISSSCNESFMEVFRDNSPALKQTETASNDDGKSSLSSISHSQDSGMALTKAHCSLLGVLISELQMKVAAYIDPNFDYGELRPKRGRRKDADTAISILRSKVSILPVNELTWPELARRYILSVISMDCNLDSAEVTAREGGRVFRCLQGDGGVLCGSLTGIVGMEADALLLAGATKQIFGSLTREKDVLTLEEVVTDETSVCEKNNGTGDDIPEWAKVLEPVRKLPTNVGTRIRKCVYDALERCPPEWAKKRLEHSISKEVYKGNASGPTKKAVISVLSDVLNGGLSKKPEKKNKRKITIPISEIIMKQCRIVLRRAAAADDQKVFCTLLGRSLVTSCDNDDEGLLGSPAMVSRPLDFRTIDLRLAVGAYGGSPESFLEDVRELWINIRTAFADQPEYVDLADTLSSNFEALYEKEVVTLVQKFEEYAKLDQINSETKKEIDDLLASTNEIPKAPWEDGICKVCGVDKDDDSVLLCDTCDAEYHTYCLNPPLARIPDGNWYCPSCVVGEHIVQEASQSILVTGRRRCNKYHGEVTHIYLDALMHLAIAMEEREYWELTVDERIFLLKFLCDELLSSSLVRQHLEQCVETTAELQQKLRSLSLEWKSLKSKEEFLISRAKLDNSAVGECPVSVIKSQDGLLKVSPNLNDRPHHINTSDEHAVTKGVEEQAGSDGCDHYHSVNSQRDLCGASQTTIMDIGNIPSRENDESLQPNDMKETQHQGNLQGDGLVSSVAVDESESYHIGLSTIKKDILNPQNSITSKESQLLNLSLRMEFLGSDSRGGLYWGSFVPGKRPRVIVDGSLTLQQKAKVDPKDLSDSGSVPSNSHSSTSTCSSLEGSRASFPFVYNSSDVTAVPMTWVSYETDVEIEELLDWLKDSNPKERELRDSIVQWLTPRVRYTQQNENLGHEEHQLAFPECDSAMLSNCLVTSAAVYLEKQYGACLDFDTNSSHKNQGKKARTAGEEKMYRCDCLEAIWPSRHHCLSCHKTFSHNINFEGHNDGRCNLVPSKCEKNGETFDSLKAKRNMQSEISQQEHFSKMDLVGTSKSDGSMLSSSLIKFQNEGITPPFDIKEISTKFVTQDSNKELVEEIGLIGSNGIPSFITSISPYLSESTLMLIPSHGDSTIGGGCKFDKRCDFPQGKGREELPDNSARKTTDSKINGVLENKKPPLGCSGQNEIGRSHCCVVPQSSLRSLVGKFSPILRRLKCNLLDMEAALSEEALRPSRAQIDKRWAWREYVKSARSIYEMVQATILLEEMIKTQFLRSDRWYWTSLSAAAKTSTVASLALRIYSLDAAIIYEKNSSGSDPTPNRLNPSSKLEQKPLSCLEVVDKCKVNRKSSRKRKEQEG